MQLPVKKRFDEKERLDELYDYKILDSLPENEYNELTKIASLICDVPYAHISFLDKDRNWYKATVGFDMLELPREISFCTQIIDTELDVVVVEDSREDDRFKNNPLVTGESNIVFYAGAPLVTKKGYTIGTVCVLDTKQKKLTQDQIDGLRILSYRVVKLLEMRNSNMELERMKLELEHRNKELEQFAMVVAHDIKTPLSSILISSELLQNDLEPIDENLLKLFKIIDNSSVKIKSLVDGILSYSRGKNHNHNNEIDLLSFCEGIKNVLSSSKEFVIGLPEKTMKIRFNRVQLEQIFLNLISNSFKYNDNPVVFIEIDYHEDDNLYYFSVKDNGIGIDDTNKEKIFDLFTVINKTDAYGSQGSGIGLATVKKIIENAGGRIKITSNDIEGSTFSFTISKQQIKSTS